MAYTNFQHCTANEYKNIIYNQETYNKIKILFNNVELEDADEYCESFEVVSRVIPNGSKIFMLENLVSQEATLVLHNIDTSIIQDQVSISIGTLVSENTYEYVPIGIYNLQEIPTTDNGKTTIKLRDNSVKLDFNYNAKPLIDEHGGTATKLQILQDICTKAGITCNVSSFIGSSDLIGIYDNTITGRQYVAWLAGSAGAIPIITRTGALDFKYLNNLSTIEIPIETVEQYSNAENFKISRVVYEDAIRKYESGNETYDTLFLDSANPYISSQEQVASIYNIVNNFEINSFTTGRILGNPAIDSYDLIQITDYDGTIFKTFANNTLKYNGKMINTFASEISFERKKENVSLKSGATFKKWAKTEIDNANAQITIQAGQIEEIEQDLSSPTNTLTGEYFDLEDALDSPLIDFSLYGETQQDSTTGKNKLPNTQTTQTINGITFTINKDRSVKVKGTATARTDLYFIGNSSTYVDIGLQTNNYVLSGVSGGSSSSVGLFCVLNRSGSTTVYANYDGETSISIQSGDTFRMFIRVANGAVVDTTIYPMLRLSNTTDDYEPYTGGSPAPSPSYPFDIHNVSGDNTIEICGKNRFKGFDFTRTLNGITFTYNANGEIEVSGTSTATTNSLTFAEGLTHLITLNEGTYTISGGVSNVRLQVLDSEGNELAITTDSTYTKSFTLNKTKQIWTRLRVTSNKTIPSGTKVYLQLEKGEATEYEAYQGNSQLISLGVENLFDKESVTTRKYLTNENVETLATGWNISDYIKVNANEKYTYQGLTTAGSSPYSCYYDSSKNFVSSFKQAVGVNTITIPNGVSYVRFSLRNSAEYLDLATFMIEKGRKANSYSEYGKPYIELNKISTYQDYIYRQDNRWYLHKEIGKVVLDGSENYGYSQQTNNVFYTSSAIPNINNTYNKPFSDYYKGEENVHTATQASNKGNNIICCKDYDSQIYITDNRFTNVTDFKNWLSTHNTIVYYVLNEATETEITDTTLLEQLNRLMTLPLYKNMTHITLTPNDLQPTMKIEYYRDTSINNNYLPREEITKYYTKTETNAQIQINSSSIQQNVSELSNTVNSNTGAITSISNQVQTLQSSTSQQINIINEQLENGVTKVKTTTGFTFDEQGLNITKGENFKNLITDRNQKIESNGKEIMFMGYDDTQQKNVARIDDIESKRATIGVHRCETTGTGSNKRTAWFYVGGGN